MRRAFGRIFLVVATIVAVLAFGPGGVHRAEPAAAVSIGSPIMAPFRGMAAPVGDTWGGGDNYHSTDSPAIDFRVGANASIYAAGDGVLARVTSAPANCYVAHVDPDDACPLPNHPLGTHVIIRHADGRYSVYGHLSNVKPTLVEGNAIAAGAFLGYSGDSGYADGAHLHYAERNGVEGDEFDPGPMDVCVNGSRATYPAAFGSGITSWTQADNNGKTLLSDDYNCILSSGSGSGNPIGTVDKIASSSPGTVKVAGWAFDPNAKTTPVSIHVYLGGTPGAPGAEGHNLGAADGKRTDVGDAYAGVGDYHGFSESFTTAKTGSQAVYVYAINASGTSGSNVLIGSKTITIANPSPKGAYDSLTSQAPGTLRVRGWSFDPSDTARATSVHAYLGGPAGAAGVEGKNLGPADGYRPDVDDVHGAGSYHGFDATFRTNKTGSVPVYVYAINLDGTPGSNVLLGVKTVSVAPSACVAPAAGPFTDVGIGHPFCKDIEWVEARGIDTGPGDGTYRPSTSDSREMLAAQFFNYSGKPAFTPPTISPFSDVPTNAVHYKEIAWLADMGITTGYGDGTFRPGSPVNRMSMAAFFYRLAGSPAFAAPTKPPFVDVATNHPFAKEIAWLASTGITTGWADGTYRPNNPVSREAMAAFLWRYRVSR